MKLLLKSIVVFAISVGVLAEEGISQDSAPQTAVAIPIDKLLPAETQGCLHVANLPEFIEHWNSTQLGILGNDERLKPFWNAQRAEIQKRFADAGWQLNLKASDLYEISTGQAGVAWVAQPQNARLPYAVCLVMDVAGKRDEAQKLLETVDAELKKRGATSKDSQVAGTAVREYALPQLPGEVIIRNSFYSLTETQLYATDDISLLSNLIYAYKKGEHENSLAKEKTYQETVGKLSEDLADHDLQYFVRPIGFAKALRSISGRAAAGQTDVLKVLENQGFSKLSAVVGRVRLKTDKYDLLHEAFVTTETPLPEPVQILDFPNTAAHVLPGWIGEDVSSVTSLAWNANEAFWKVRSIVDEFAGQEGTFEEVVKSIQEDPLGPRIDIRKDVLPYLTNQIYVVTDTLKPITVDSRRALIAIEVNDPSNKLRDVLNRAMENEPDAQPEDYKGHRIWKVTHDDQEIEIDIDEDFGDFGGSKGSANADAEAGEDEEPLLNNWAIAKHENFLFFASHFELIKEVVDVSESKNTESKLFKQADVAPIVESLDFSTPHAVWRIMRTDKSFEMQYELFRRDELPQSKTILAVLLDRLLNAKTQVKSTDQKVKGDLLPEYSQISEYLSAIGYSADTTEGGWRLKSFIMGK